MNDQSGQTPTPNGIEIAPGRTLPEAAMHFRFARGGGPGGQNVNKVATKATLRVRFDDLAQVLPGQAMGRLQWVAKPYLTDDGLQITSADSRSQHANRKACISKLRAVVIKALHRPKPRKPTRPSRRANQRRLDEKKHRGRRKAQRDNSTDASME